MNLSMVQQASKSAFEELFNYRERRELENTIYRVYVPFAHRHEQWVNNLFDYSFLVGSCFNVLVKASQNAESVSTRDLAQAWADQFGFEAEQRDRLIEQAMGIADEFLRVFLREFENKPASQPDLAKTKGHFNNAATPQHNLSTI